VVAPGLMVAAIILFMGAVSGAHLNPAVSLAFAVRRDFPWRRVPGYIVTRMLGATLACLFLLAVIGNFASLVHDEVSAAEATESATRWEPVRRDVEKIEGDLPPAQIYLIIEWPAKRAAEAFYDSDEYKPYLESRRNGSTGEFVLVAGEDVNGVAHM